MKKPILPASLFLVFFICAGELLCQQQAVEKAFARKTTQPLTIDGILDESVWSRAEVVNDLLYVHADRLNPHLVDTTVRLLYDEKNLYFAFICRDSQPENIKATVTVRDGDMRVDDSIYVLLDLFANIDNYFFFATNPLGTQADGVVNKNGLVLHPQYNGDWQAGVQRTDEGWTAEISINLTVLQYVPEEGVDIGISLSRVVPRLDSSFWTEPMDPAFKISEMPGLGAATFALIEKWIQILPYVLPFNSQQDGTGIDAGLDIPLKFSRTTRGHVTVKPDFMTVEPDKEIFNLTRYEIRVPEKRVFFNQFEENYPHAFEQLFYSRRVGDIYGGAQFQTQAGAFRLAAMSVQVEKDDSSGLESANFSSFRLNSRISRSSAVGIVAANKLIGGQNFGAAGVDTSLNLSRNLNISGQAAVSYGDYDTGNTTFSIRPSFDSETFHFHIGYTHVGENFQENANNVGFVWDDNRREIDSGIRKAFVVRTWGIERVQYSARYNIFWGTEGTLRSWQMDQGFSLLKVNRFEINVSHTQEYKLFEKEYRNHQTRFFIGLDTREWQLFNIILSTGRNFERSYRLAEINKRLRISRKMNVEYGFQSLNFPFTGGNRTQKFWSIHVLRIQHNFNQNVTAHIFWQRSSLVHKTNLQFIVSYRFKPPFGLLQAGYQSGDPIFGLAREDQETLFVKAIYAF